MTAALVQAVGLVAAFCAVAGVAWATYRGVPSALVDALPEPLSPSERRRLIDLLEAEAPDLVPTARNAVNGRWLTDDEAGALKRVLLDVFLRSLDEDDEPDRRGAEADDLLGRVEMHRRAYWDT